MGTVMNNQTLANKTVIFFNFNVVDRLGIIQFFYTFNLNFCKSFINTPLILWFLFNKPLYFIILFIINIFFFVNVSFIFFIFISYNLFIFPIYKNNIWSNPNMVNNNTPIF